jgi:hypothetical protein
MTEKEVLHRLRNTSPTGYIFNRVELFSYPIRRIKIEVLVNKQPEGSMLNVYNSILRAIQAGFHSQMELFKFLGLGEQDEFMTRELFYLREKGYVDLFSENWMISVAGENYLKTTQFSGKKKLKILNS